MKKYYKILEFDKIIEQVKKEAILDTSKNIIEEGLLYSDINLCSQALEETNEAASLKQRLGSLPIHFSVDVRKILSLTSKGGVVSLTELAHIMAFLDTLRDSKLYLEKMNELEVDSLLISTQLESLVYPKELNKRIKEIIDPDANILDSASPALYDIRRNEAKTEEAIRKKLQEMISRYGDKLTGANITIRNERFVLPVKNEYKSLFKGIVHDSSASGSTVYIEPTSVFELTNKLASLKEDEKREIFNILKDVSTLIAIDVASLLSSYDVLVNLDIEFAKAIYSISINGNIVNLNKDGKLELLNAHHPLLNVEKVVSNNIIIGEDYKSIVITGPNTGGKTVLLKTIGLLSLMVKFGLLIPASPESTVMLFDDIYCDIGDEQSIESNLSTFSSHLTNVIDIMRHVTNNSLVLLDELGSGTDPLEGSSLAISILDYLIERHSLIVATSHYPELKIHAYNSKDLINASVEFDEATLKPTYRLLIGVPGMSNALNIASRLGLPKDVVIKAKEHAYSQNDDINQVLEKLIKQSRVLDKKISEADNVKKDLEKQLLEAKLKYQEEIAKHEAIIKKANEDASRLIESKMEEINDLISDLKAKKNSSSLPEIADLKHRARSLEDEYLDSSIIDDHKFIVGDSVFIKPYECNGKIIRTVGKGKFLVQMGNANITVEEEDLRFVEEIKHEYIKPIGEISVSTKKSVSSRLDLRGMRYEEAAQEIDKFLDDCVYANLTFASIIHGFGTGTIRELVHDKLSKCKDVKEYRYGGPGEGGQGATIVTFKE